MDDRALQVVSGLASCTAALRRVIERVDNAPVLEDLLFLEAWERHPSAHVGVVFRAHQIRRANPQLAAEIRAELRRGRPLTPPEREALLAAQDGRSC